MKKLSFLLYAAILIAFSSCVNETLAPERQLDDDDSVSFFDPQTQELIHLENLDELKSVLKDKYAKHEKLDDFIKEVDAFQYELNYSRTLDLTDPQVAEEYESYLQDTYAPKQKIVPGQLRDNGNFLMATAFPRNLPTDRRNRADSFQAFAVGGNFFCDRTWFRGPRIYILGFIGIEYDFANFNFVDRTESIM